MKRLILAALIVGVISPAWGDFLDGNVLHERCQDETGGINDGYCFGYLAGVVDAMRGRDGRTGDITFCFQSNVSLRQVRDVVKNWLNANPQHRNYNADSLVAAALSEVWPCK